MATKNKKQSVRERYAAILAERGENIDDCTVLAFVFPKGGKEKTFHYSLMLAEPAVPYLIFDATGNGAGKAQVVVKKDANNESRIRAIAEIHGGHRTVADL